VSCWIRNLDIANWLVDYGWLVIVAIMLMLSVANAGHFYRGRHRGGYVEKPAWGRWGDPLNEIEVEPGRAKVVGSVLIRDYRLPENHGRFGDLDIDCADATPRIMDPDRFR